jgi:L-fucose isomerase-like protein
MTFNYIPVASELLPPSKYSEIIADYIPHLEKIGGQLITREQLLEHPPLLYFIVGGGTENIVLNLRKERNKAIPLEPVYLLVHPTNNSLPAALEILARLHQENVQGKIIYIKGPQDATGYVKVSRAMGDLAVFQSLRNARLGIVGYPSDWLVASMPGTELIRETWGPEIISIPFDELKSGFEKIKNSDVSELKAQLENNAVAIVEPTSDEISDSVKVYLALKNIVKKYNLTAISVRCFDLVLDCKTTGCFALGKLMDDGIIAGCEGDLVSTIGLLWANLMVNKIPWMANPAQIDLDNNSIWLAHCTVPMSIVQNYTIRSHFESGLGVGIAGTLWNGPVTLLRIGGKSLDKIWLAEGDVIHSGKSENLCRTQVEVKITAGNSVEQLLESPLGNHMVMVAGNHLKRFETWWNTMRCNANCIS